MEVKHFGIGDMTILGTRPGTCPECGVVHEPELPHNIKSMFYQVKFYQANNRWPTFEDASAHCTPEIIALWKETEVQVRKELGLDGHGQGDA